jgi:hypothetical protein
MAMETLSPEATMPPQLVGLAFSLFGMLFGSIAMRPPGHTAAGRPAPAHGRGGR